MCTVEDPIYESIIVYQKDLGLHKHTCRQNINIYSPYKKDIKQEVIHMLNENC